MKTTYKSDEIAHAWFHGLSPVGTCSANMSFDGPLFLSYSTGLARKIEHKGKRAVVINDRSFSITTSKHQSMLRRAIPSDAIVIHVNGEQGTSLNASPGEIFAYQVEKSAECLKLAASATKRKAEREGQAAMWLHRAQEVSDFFGLRRKVDMKTAERLAASSAREEKRQAAERAKREDAERAKQAEAYEAWKQGEGDEYFNPSLFPVAFRVEGDELVSTLGARVPVKDAKVALRFIQSRKGAEWRENGETCHVGGYKVNSITPAGIVAGCHRITWAEVEHVAAILPA